MEENSWGDFYLVQQRARGGAVSSSTALTNLCYATDALSGAYWNISLPHVNYATINTGITDPAGGTSAVQIYTNATTTGYHAICENKTLGSAIVGNIAFALYVKAGTQNGNYAAINIGDVGFNNGLWVAYNIATGAIDGVYYGNWGSGYSLVSQTIVTDSIATGSGGNGWYRAELIFTSTATTILVGIWTQNGVGGATNYSGTVGDNIYVYGPQMNAGAAPTAYVVNSGTS